MDCRIVPSSKDSLRKPFRRRPRKGRKIVLVVVASYLSCLLPPFFIHSLSLIPNNPENGTLYLVTIMKVIQTKPALLLSSYGIYLGNGE